MDRTIHTAILIHLAREWRVFHRRDLIRALAATIPEGWAILAVNRPITLDVTLVREPKRLFREARRREPQQLGPRLYLCTPRQISHELIADRIPGMPSVNRRLVHRQLRQALTGLFPSARSTIDWLYSPMQMWVSGSRPGGKLVYECYDEYGMRHDGSIRSRFQAKEKTLLARADLAFVTAEILAHRRNHLARRIAYLPNGVTAEFLTARPAQRPAATRTPPCIGYLGNLRSEIDHDLLAALVSGNTQWKFVFVGPVEKGRFSARLSAFPNVEFLGPRPHEQLPNVLQAFDVGLVPFILNDFTAAINPLKAYEYMAAGVPIVASDLPELRKFRDSIRLVPNTAEAFTRAIARTLAEDRKILGEKLIAIARDYTWDAICKNIVVPELTKLAES